MKITSPRTSLHWRLPLLILALLASLGLAFTWTAYREMRHALRTEGEQRVATAGAQLADLLSQSAAARVAELRRLAENPAVRRFAETGEDADAAMAVLRTFVERSPQVTLVLRARGGAEAVHIREERLDVMRSSDFPDRAGGSAPTEGVGALQLEQGRVSYDTNVLIRSNASTGSGAASSGPATAFISVERPLTSSSGAALIERLMGHGAMLKFGNATGDLWTDLAAPVASPPAAEPGAPAVTFVDANGASHLGGVVQIQGTPWRVWVAFSETALMQPAQTLVRRMLPWTVALILAGVLAVRIVSARITAPIEKMAEAADAIASGDYSRRVAVKQHDEIGRLGTAFNVMAGRVAESHDALEERVKERTKELQQTREELDQFFSMSLDLMCIADPKGSFTRVNPAWETALGWNASDLVARPYVDLVHPDDVEPTLRETAALALGGTTVNFENRFLCRDGSYRWLNWNSASSHDMKRIYGSARDVTKEKNAASELQKYAAELAAANRELEAFSYSVSHDLRAPLRSIDGFSQALIEDFGEQIGGDGADYLRRIRAAAQHMGRLIDDLLKLARVTRVDLRLETVDLSGMAEATFRTLAESDETRDVNWRVQPGLVARADPRLLQIVMTNLLENAWKFTGKINKAEIEFASRDVNGKTEYFVKDNGSGFDPAYAAKLFGAFQRLHAPTEFPGTGIGLATVQRIVTRHGGTTRAEGAVGQGATFAFTLPTGSLPSS
jgi:PAS domain S-box-containing protein